jgi:hypothetical protein
VWITPVAHGPGPLVKFVLGSWPSASCPVVICCWMGVPVPKNPTASKRAVRARPIAHLVVRSRPDVAAMEGGLGVWLQTASGIVPIGPAGFRSPSVLGLAVQTRAARPPLVPGSRRVLAAALLLMLARDFVRSRASVEELILAAGLPPRPVRAVRTATEMAAIAFRVELRDCRGVTAGRPDGRLLSSGIRRFR